MIRGGWSLLPISLQAAHLSYVFDNCFIQILFTLSSWADLMTLLMSMERIVALWIPQKFSSINTKKFVIGGIAVCGVTSSLFLIDIAQLNTDNSSTWLADSTTYKNYQFARDLILTCRGYVILALTIVVCLGLIRKSKKRGKNWHKSTNRELCILSMNVSIPIAISSTVFFIYTCMSDAPYISAAANDSFDSLVFGFREGIAFLVIVFFQTTLNIFAHYYHFLIYFAFCESFRKVTLATFNRQK